MRDDASFHATINRLNGEIRVVGNRIKALDKKRAEEVKLRKRLRMRLRMLSKHHSDKDFVARFRAGNAKFWKDPEKRKAVGQKISAKRNAPMNGMTPEQRETFNIHVIRGKSYVVARALALGE